MKKYFIYRYDNGHWEMSDDPNFRIPYAIISAASPCAADREFDKIQYQYNMRMIHLKYIGFIILLIIIFMAITMRY